MIRTMRHAAISLFISFIACSGVSAAPWELQQMLTPPAQAGYAGTENIGFGRTTALGKGWLAVGTLTSLCADSGSVFLYRHDVASAQYVFAQEICDVGRGDSIAIWGEWMLIGWSHHDNTPGDGQHNGRVSFLRLDAVLQRWNVVQTFDGAADSLLGHSVAMENGVAAAGESGYQNDRGRVRSWRLAADGASWVSEGWLYGPGPALPRPVEPQGFGSAVDLDIRDCRAPACTSARDALVVLARAGLYTYERQPTGWGTAVLTAPADGTTTAFTDVAINDSLVVATALMQAHDPAAPCSVAIQTTEMRVLHRISGSVRLRPAGFACRDRLGLAPLAQFVRTIALAPKGHEFHFSSPDYPAVRLGVVSSWDGSGTGTAIRPHDAIVDPDLTSVLYAQSGSIAHHPDFMGDYFGGGLAATGRELAIGAKFYNALIGNVGPGYVVIYRR